MREGFFPESTLLARESVSVVPKCGACGLFKTCNSPKMEVDGHGKRKILIVGEAPGKDEDLEGKPFVGKTGQYLESTLRRHGIVMRRDCWITNALICRPPKNKILKENEKVAYCRPNVMNAIKKYRPRMILAVGNIAVKSLIGHIWKENTGPLTRWVGWKIPSQELNTWIFPIWHPSYIMREQERNPAAAFWFDKQIKRFSRLEGRPWKEIPDYESQIELIRDPVEAARIIRKFIKKGGLAAFDYETNMLKPDSSRFQVLCCSICWEGKRTIVFPWTRDVVPAMKEFILSNRIRKIASNIKYEDRVSRRVFGEDVVGWEWCTMNSAHVLDCRKGITSVKFQAFVRLGVGAYDSFIDPFKKAKDSNSLNRLKEVKEEQLWTYCGMDSLLEFLVYELQLKEMTR